MRVAVPYALASFLWHKSVYFKASQCEWLCLGAISAVSLWKT
jgi:hypothetical protein